MGGILSFFVVAIGYAFVCVGMAIAAIGLGVIAVERAISRMFLDQAGLPNLELWFARLDRLGEINVPEFTLIPFIAPREKGRGEE